VSSLATLAADLQARAAHDEELRAASVRDHQRIVRALRSRDKALAAETMDSHLKTMWRGVERVIESADERQTAPAAP
jgi:DNA-binding GntR family transcriptional regulator